MSQNPEYSNNKKYLDLLNAAQDLFWKHGFKRVTVEEICREAGVSKMTFYRFFRDKVELAKRVYENVVEKGMQDFKAIIKSDLSPGEKIKKFILLKYEGTNNISHEFLKDFYDHSDSELAKFVDSKVNQVWIEIRSDFKIAQDNGMFRKDLNMDFLMYFLNKLDYTDKELLKLFHSPQEMVMEVLNLFLYGISPVR